jgi:hypothetical protein
LNFIHEFSHDLDATTTGARTSRVSLRAALGAYEYVFFRSGHGLTP